MRQLKNLLMNNALHCAIRLLARREHSLAELADKLAQKGHVDVDIQDALATCQRQGLQSDARFAESLCRTRVRQGYGPVKIRQELLSKKVSRELADETLRTEQHNWLDHAMQVWIKKYQGMQDVSFAEKQKQRQFLMYRGFTMDIIAEIVL